MTNTPYDAAAAAIYQATLGAAAERQAFILLNSVSGQGHIKCTKDALCMALELSWGSIRRLLGTLQQANIIHYSTNDFVYIDFRAWPPIDAIDHPSAKNAHPSADDGAIAHPSAVDGAIDHPRMEDLTNKLTRPNQNEVAQSFALLTFVRVRPNEAKQLAIEHPFERIREACAHWWMNRKSLGGDFEEVPGIVVYWLKNWDTSSIPPLAAEFMRTDLYTRFRTPAEIERDRAIEAERIEMEQAAPRRQTNIAPEEDETRRLWREAVGGLRGQQHAALADEPVERHGTDHGEHWRVQLSTDANRRQIDWLRTQATRALERTLSLLTDCPVQVEWVT